MAYLNADAVRWALTVPVAGPHDRLMLIFLASHVGKREPFVAWPSLERCREQTKLDVRTVTACLRRLAGAGLILDTGERRGTTRRVKVFRLNTGIGAGIKDAQPDPQSPHGCADSIPTSTPPNPPMDASRNTPMDEGRKEAIEINQEGARALGRARCAPAPRSQATRDESERFARAHDGHQFIHEDGRRFQVVGPSGLSPGFVYTLSEGTQRSAPLDPTFIDAIRAGKIREVTAP